MNNRELVALVKMLDSRYQGQGTGVSLGYVESVSVDRVNVTLYEGGETLPMPFIGATPIVNSKVMILWHGSGNPVVIGMINRPSDTIYLGTQRLATLDIQEYATSGALVNGTGIVVNKTYGSTYLMVQGGITFFSDTSNHQTVLYVTVKTWPELTIVTQAEVGRLFLNAADAGITHSYTGGVAMIPNLEGRTYALYLGMYTSGFYSWTDSNDTCWMSAWETVNRGN